MADNNVETSVLVDLDGLTYYTAKQDLKNNNTFAKKADAADKTYVDNKVAGLIDSAPDALDTLKELSAALNNDANFASTVTTAIGQKIDKGDAFRKPGTAYAVGDFVLLNALENGKKLVCVKAGTTANSALSASTVEGALITDGTCVWQVDSFADGNYYAAHQNGIYRGADLTAYWQSGHMSTNIRAGKFVGMHIGDYIVKSVTTAATTYTNKSGISVTQDAATYADVRWVIAGFDNYLKRGDISGGDLSTVDHHIILIHGGALQRNVSMNPTDSTDGAYVGSDMWKVHMPIWSNAIKNAFGSDHVLRHRELLSNAINATADSASGSGFVGTTTACFWVYADVNIPTESMIYDKAFSSSGQDVADFPTTLPIFSLCRSVFSRSWFWLRSVSSSKRFCYHTQYGNAGARDASVADIYGGICPYFLAH